MLHLTPIRIYYEDTDAGGVVYYANYLKFAERARTEMLRDLGIHQGELLDKQSIAFVVRHADLDLKSPARLDDALMVRTHLIASKPASLTLQQHIVREQQELCVVRVKIACVNAAFKPTKLPKDLLEKLSKSL